MIERRKFALLIEDLYRGIATKDRKERFKLLSLAAMDLCWFTSELSADPLKVGSLLEVLIQLRASGGAGSARAEERILRSAQAVIDGAITRYASEDVGAQGTRELSMESMQVLQLLGTFARDSLQFTKPRDSFSGRRRGFAFEILAGVGRYVPMPGIEEKAIATLAGSDGDDVRSAIEYLRSLYGRENTGPDVAITDTLLTLVERTPSRSVAFGALDLLVSTGTINEFDAMNRMDDWKEKHR